MTCLLHVLFMHKMNFSSFKCIPVPNSPYVFLVPLQSSEKTNGPGMYSTYFYIYICIMYMYIYQYLKYI